MSATILVFTGRTSPRPAQGRRQAVAGLSTHFGSQWANRHLPLVVAALDMLQAEDADFAQRCSLIATEPGAIDGICGQLMRLASHMRDVAEALVMTAQRIRRVHGQAAIPSGTEVTP